MSDIGSAGNSPNYPGNYEQEEAAPYRLQNLKEDDPYAPETSQDPGEGTDLADYAHESTLPRGVPHSSGDFVSFGSVDVPTSGADDYQAVREHMIQGGPTAQKYLHAFENLTQPGEGGISYTNKVRAYPFRPGTKSIPSLDGGPGLKPKTRTFISSDGSKRDDSGDIMIVSFNSREGYFTESGGLQSAATGAAHEIAHGARGPGAGEAMDGWENREEHHVITKIENPVAKANVEEPRDTHRYAGRYETDGIRSTHPVDPRMLHVFRQHRPGLMTHTALMDEHGLGTINHDHEIVRSREGLAQEAANAVKAIERERRGDTGDISSEGSSIEEDSSMDEGDSMDEGSD